MKPCISQVTTLSATFAEDIAAYADAGWHAVELWLTKLETHLERHTVAETRKLLEDKGIVPAAASFQGGLLESERGPGQRQVHFDHFRRRLEICQSLGIPHIVVAADFHQPVDAAGIEAAVASLREAAQWAAGANVTLALEFLAPSEFCNNLQTALALVESAGEPNIGVNLDLFHFWTGPSKTEDLSLLTPGDLAFVQVCDVAGVLRELATDADRILPGDGDIDAAAIFRRLEEIGYNGCVSLEVMNPSLWRMKPSQVAELGRKALERWTSNQAGGSVISR
jgi:sugar phosphate isomerase/epimerase